MRNSSVFFFVFGIFAASSTLSAAPLKSTTVMHNIVRQCEYINGVTIRLLASRECPAFEAIPSPAPTAPPPKVELKTQDVVLPISSSAPNHVQVSTQDSTMKNEDAILDKSINRCTIIGFKKDTEQFRNCVIEQIKILSK